jgi:hypothetical protein
MVFPSVLIGRGLWIRPVRYSAGMLHAKIQLQLSASLEASALRAELDGQGALT